MDIAVDLLQKKYFILEKYYFKTKKSYIIVLCFLIGLTQLNKMVSSLKEFYSSNLEYNKHELI